MRGRRRAVGRGRVEHGDDGISDTTTTADMSAPSANDQPTPLGALPNCSIQLWSSLPSGRADRRERPDGPNEPAHPDDVDVKVVARVACQGRVCGWQLLVKMNLVGFTAAYES